MNQTSSLRKTAQVYLDSLKRSDLSALLQHARIEFEDREGLWGDETVVVVRAPRPFSEALTKLSDLDRKRIVEAAVSRSSLDIQDPDIIFETTNQSLDGPIALLPELILHREMMMAVATGQQTIRDVDDYYVARQERLAAGCAAAGIPYGNPHASLWDWYHFWKGEGMGTYADRRQYLRTLFKSPVAAAVSLVHKPSPVLERDPTGWDRVDRTTGKAKMQLSQATSEEEWQTIGLLCREILISLGQAVYDQDVHGETDDTGTRIGSSDARRQLFAWLNYQAAGGSNKEIRAHIKASIELAVHLQHRRTATYELAALCLEATSSAVALVSIIAGRANAKP